MRQLRIKSNLCSMQKMNFTCEYDYTWSNEITTIKSNSTIQQAFQHHSNDQLDTYVSVGDHGSYSDDGYVYEFRSRLSEIQSNLSELHELRWIDTQTRAIIIQLFTSVTLLIEFLSTGGIYPQSHSEPINFYSKFIYFFAFK